MPTASRPRTAWASPRAPPHRPPDSAAPPGRSAVYRRRRPTATPLYPTVQHDLETFLAAEADPWGEGMTGWGEDDFLTYLPWASWPAASPAPAVTTAPPSASSPSPARAAASAPPATRDAWSRSPRTCLGSARSPALKPSRTFLTSTLDPSIPNPASYRRWPKRRLDFLSLARLAGLCGPGLR
jgi:hypothetical protein